MTDVQAHAIRINRNGGPEVLEWTPVTLGAPGKGEVLIRHTAVGLNFIDTYHRSGLYPQPLPTGLGSEAAGVVEAVGEGVDTLQVGDRVGYCWGPVGAYATHRIIAADRLVKLPDGIDDETAAAALLKGCTTEYLVERCAAVQPGESVLVHAAAGGVGLLLVQWLKAVGATVIGTTSSDAKAELARAHGCDHVIRYDREDVAERVREITGGARVRVVIDGVGRATWEGSLDSLRPRGLMVSFGNASGPVTGVNLGILASKGSLYVTRPTMAAYYASRAEIEAGSARLFEMIRSGALKVRIDQRFPLADASEAHRALESRATTGSTLLLP